MAELRLLLEIVDALRDQYVPFAASPRDLSVCHDASAAIVAEWRRRGGQAEGAAALLAAKVRGGWVGLMPRPVAASGTPGEVAATIRQSLDADRTGLLPSHSVALVELPGGLVLVDATVDQLTQLGAPALPPLVMPLTDGERADWRAMRRLALGFEVAGSSASIRLAYRLGPRCGDLMLAEAWQLLAAGMPFALPQAPSL